MKVESGKFGVTRRLQRVESGKWKVESGKSDNFQFSTFNSQPDMHGSQFTVHCSQYDTFLPSGNRNYTIVSPEKVDYFVKCRENALPYLSEILENSNNETQITETLYILDKMLDAKVEGIDKMYPVLARFNNTKSPNIQTFLAGIYRKTQVPDAFGPLVKMLVQNSIHPPKSNFDPNEEIGGAILSYLNPRFRR